MTSINGTFESVFPRPQKAPFWKSDKETPQAKKLQEALTKAENGNYSEVDQKLKTYLEDDHFFRLTEGNFYEVTPGDYKEVKVKIQVKEGTITWYFSEAGHDETTQEFRDQIFRTAALGHLLVPDACAKYYRGTNSMHVKRMHTSEQESKQNHNHYRVQDNHVTPAQFKAHLEGFLKAQRAYGIEDKFLTEEEALKLIDDYKEFDAKLDEKIDDLKTKREVFHEQEKVKWTELDKEELADNKQIEEPCEAQVMVIPLNENQMAVEGVKILPKEWINHPEFSRTTLDLIAKVGSEGQRSDRAHTRQMEPSTLPTLPNAYTKLGELFDKRVNKNYPSVEEPSKKLSKSKNTEVIEGEKTKIEVESKIEVEQSKVDGNTKK